MKRNRAIDYEKGIIVAFMVLCHVLQFFGKPDMYPAQDVIMLIVNFMAFPTFVFAYGRSTAVAYLSRSWKEAASRMLKSALRSYAAFVISGVSYLVLCAGEKFSDEIVLDVLTFEAVPGWSEFLAAFAAFGLVATVLFPLMKKMAQNGRLTLIVSALCFAGVLVPYRMIGDNRLGLLIGTRKYGCFPVMQYMPFFLAGIYTGVNGMPNRKIWLAMPAAASVLAGVYLIVFGTPRRFPPSLMWLLLPCLMIVLLDRGAEWINRAANRRMWVKNVMSPIGSMGMNSLFYLLVSNIVIFAVSRMGTLPTCGADGMFPFSLEQGSTIWALFWTLAMLLVIGFLTGLIRKESRKA